MAKQATTQSFYSPEAEQAVLGAVLLRPAVLDEVADLLWGPEAFYRPAHQEIYRAMLELYRRREPVDLVTVTAWLRDQGKLEEAGGPVFLAGLSEQVGTTANALFYARIVRDKARLRHFVDSLARILAAAKNGGGGVEDVDEFLGRAEAELYRAAHTEAGRGQPLPVRQALQEAVVQIAHQRRDSLPPGITTGYYDLDARIGGLEPGNLYVMAARPGMGKTALALNIALKVAQGGTPVLFLSLETSVAQLARRVLAEVTRLDHHRLRTGELEDAEWERLTNTVDSLQVPLYLDDQGAMTHLEVRARARRAAARWGLGLLVVDYLQLVSAPEAKSREQEVATLSRSFKALAKELDAPVLVLAQLNRACEARTDKRPVLSDLRESGAIEQDADVVAFIYRDDYYREDSPDKGVAEILVRKNRHGPTGTVKLQFMERTVTFRNLAQDIPF